MPKTRAMKRGEGIKASSLLSSCRYKVGAIKMCLPFVHVYGPPSYSLCFFFSEKTKITGGFFEREPGRQDAQRKKKRIDVEFEIKSCSVVSFFLWRTGHRKTRRLMVFGDGGGRGKWQAWSQVVSIGPAAGEMFLGLRNMYPLYVVGSPPSLVQQVNIIRRRQPEAFETGEFEVRGGECAH